MKKYNKNDIKLLNEGQQIKRALEEKYKTLKDFVDIEKPELSLKSIYNYCGNNRIRSKKFKLIATKALDIDYNDLVLSDINQLKRYVFDIFYSIHLYDSESDVETFDILLDLCKQYNLQTEVAVMLRNYAKNLYNRSLLNEAIEMFEKAIYSISNSKSDISGLVLLHAELADIYFKEKDIIKANDNFKIAGKYLLSETVSDRVKYYYYYYRGIASSKSGRYEEARCDFNEALKYARVNTDVFSQKGAALLNIGNTYKRENNYEESSRYFFGALMYFHDKDTHGKSSVLNSIADNYYMQKKYSEASRYLYEAIKIAIQDGLSSASLAIAETSAELLMLNKEKSSCMQYFNVLRESINCNIDKYIIIQNIGALIKAIQLEEELLQLKEILYYLKANTSNKEYMNDLDSCIGKINEKI